MILRLLSVVSSILMLMLGINVYRSVQYLMRSGNYRGRKWAAVVR